LTPLTSYRCVVLAALLNTPAAAHGAEDFPALSVGGLLFGDLYHVPSHHLEAGDGTTGAVLRRGYLTFDADFSAAWFGRLRFEVNQDGAFETYEFKADFKDLYLGTRLGGHTLLAGLAPTITYDVIESHWGLRHLMRTPMDLQGIPSRDTGVSLKGPLNDSGSLAYRAMYGSGLEFGSDPSDSGKWMAALNWTPAPDWMIDLYADFENRPGSADRHTIQGFIAYKTATLRWGLQYAHQGRGADDPLELASAYLVKRLDEQASLIGRIDRLIEPSPKGNGISYLPFDPTARATLLLAGWEYRVNAHFRVTPNAVVIHYDRNEQGFRPTTDMHLRVTFFLEFE